MHARDKQHKQLYEACKQGNLAEVKQLLENNANYIPISQDQNFKDLDFKTYESHTPLWAAAENGHTDVVIYLLSDENPKKSEVIKTIDTLSGRTGGTLLQATVQSLVIPNLHHSAIIIKPLLAAGASPNISGIYASPPLDSALLIEDFDVVADLLLYGATSDNTSTKKLIIQYKTEITNALIKVCKDNVHLYTDLLKRIGILSTTPDEKIQPDQYLKAAFFGKRRLLGKKPDVDDKGKSCVSRLKSAADATNGMQELRQLKK